MKAKFSVSHYHTFIQCYFLNETAGGDKITYHQMVNEFMVSGEKTSHARYAQLSRLDNKKKSFYKTWFYKKNVGVQKVALESYSFRFSV